MSFVIIFGSACAISVLDMVLNKISGRDEYWGDDA